MFILVTGGASSGKSAFAEGLIEKSGKKKKIYIATTRPYDDECIKRIERHRLLRKDKGFETAEIYGRISDEKISDNMKNTAVIFECMSNYLGNNMFDENGMKNNIDSFAEELAEDICSLSDKADYTVVVTNEIFSDGEAYSAETMKYIEILGYLNRRLAEKADCVYEVVCGIPVVLKEDKRERN